MKPNIKQLFQKSLNIKSIIKESDKNIPLSNEKSTFHLSEFKQQISNICIFPL